MKLRDFLAEARLEQLRRGPNDEDAKSFRNADGSLNMDAISRYASHPRIIGGENGAGILVVSRGYHNLPGLTQRECEEAWEAYYRSEDFLARSRSWRAAGNERPRDDPAATPTVPTPVQTPSPPGQEPVPPRKSRRVRRA